MTMTHVLLGIVVLSTGLFTGLLMTITILGILITIAVIVFLALLERWRVEAAASQFAADLRLAHARATNQLTDWRVVLCPTARRSADARRATIA